MGEKRFYCYESARTRDQLFARFEDLSRAPHLTLDELLDADGVPPLSPDWGQAFHEILLEDELADEAAYRQTVDTLREALILTPDDVEFAFTTMVPTPANQKLAQLLLRYLDSPAEWDRTMRAWTYLESLKNFEIEWKRAPHVVMVPSSAGRFLFEEISKALAYADGVESTELVRPEALFPQATTRLFSPVRVRGNGAPALSRMAAHVGTLCARGVAANQIHILFEGAPASLEILRYRLAALGITHAWHGETAVPTLDSKEGDLSALLTSLRKEKSRGLKERLELTSLLLKDSLGRRPSTPWPNYFDKLERLEKITPDQKTFLLSLSENPAAPSVAPREGVTIHPAVLLPARAGDHVVAYIEEARHAEAPAELKLHPLELEAIYQAGFAVSRTADASTRQSEFLKTFAAPSVEHRVLFSTLEPPVFSRSFPLRVSPFEGSRFRQVEKLELPLPTLSATQLETFARCPSQYFFSSRTRLRRDDGGESQYALVFGKAVHLALEKHFQNAEPRVHSEEVLSTAFAEALQHYAPTLDEGHPFHVMLTQAFRKVARRVPVLEAQLNESFGPTRVLGLERKFLLRLGGGVEVRGQIDRLDAVGEGAALVLDYKTGNVDFCPDHLSRGENFQALVYLMAAQDLHHEVCAGVLFYDLKKGELRRGMVDEQYCKKGSLTRGHALEATVFEAKQEEGRARLLEVVRAMSEGEFSPTPSAQVCAQCDYAAFCREAFAHA